MRAASSTRLIALGIISAAFAAAPVLAHAQAPASDLHTIIRAELRSDPRTSGLSNDQLNAMVNLLTQEAQKRGITASDITWHPAATAFGGADEQASIDECAGLPSISCMFDRSLGFVGSDTTIPFFLGMASMGLIWIIAEMLHRKRHPMHY